MKDRPGIDFDISAKIIKESLPGRQRRMISSEALKPSAVLIPILNRNNRPYVLLTKRSDNLPVHAGQVSLPGGAYDLSDSSLMETALRETEEEVGIDRRYVSVLGQFDDFWSPYGFHVSTFAGIVSVSAPYKINPDEIEKCYEIPLIYFSESNASFSENRIYGDSSYHILHYYYADAHVWGLTAAILTDFVEKIFYGNIL